MVLLITLAIGTSWLQFIAAVLGVVYGALRLRPYVRQFFKWLRTYVRQTFKSE